MPSLIVRQNGRVEKAWRFSRLDILTIGRATTNDIVLPDETAKISRYHACLVLYENNAGRYFLRDLGSLQSTTIAGQPVTQHDLSNGDVFEIGPYQLTYHAEDSSPDNNEDDDFLTIVDSNAAANASQWFRQAQGLATASAPMNPLLEKITLTQTQQELFTGYLRNAQTSLDLGRFFQSGLDAVARTFEATSVFAACFASGTAKGFRPLGSYGLDPKRGRQLRITSKTFLEDLRNGTPVVEANVVLVPLYMRSGIVGFLCLGWEARTTPVSKSEADILCLLGQLTSVIGTDQHPNRAVEKTIVRPAVARAWPESLIGRSAPVQTLRDELRSAASTDENVLLMGPTGAGKEVAARILHRFSNFRQGPFVAYNCAALPESVVGSELFGYAANSGFAGCDPKGKAGLFESANGGVVFLDEIHTLPVGLQSTLLRVLAEKEVRRLSSSVPIPIKVHVKIIAATNEDLQRAIDKGTFRSDLFFRFGRRVHVPALADRPEDIPLLTHYFLDEFASKLTRSPLSISREALQGLASYDWPGNVRELRAVTEQVVALKRDVWFSWDLQDKLHRTSADSNTNRPGRPKSMKEVEKSHICEVLDFTRGNKSEAARILGFQSRQTLLSKMDEYEIPREYGRRPTEELKATL